MSDAKELQEVDTLIDPEDELELFKAAPVKLSEEGEQQFLSLQESYRRADHAQWNIREQKKAEAQHEHIKTTNRYNLINSVVHFASIAALIYILVQAL